MDKTTTQLKEMKIVGIQIRTNNHHEFTSQTPKIFPCVQKYFHQDLASKITNRLNPGKTFCIYTEYESDHTGEYTYFIGEEVSSFDNISNELETLTIPKQTYTKFTTAPGPMPGVVQEAWKKIWQMSESEIGGKRRYAADFEIYDERANDHNNVVLDIYIGMES